MTYLWIAGAVGVAVAAVLALLRQRARKSLLAPTLVGSVGAFLLVGGWLFVADPNAPKNEAVKTGGLAAGAIVALYALWLNDRRRHTDEERQRVEQARHELESARAEHDRSRVADERFARSVELLGHEAEQVRVGAMHALAGLARSRPEYAQTALDLLCAYLRRPFNPAADPRERTPEEERELEVRLTAQRLIADLLPRADAEGAPRYDLNLTRAHLEYFDISHRQVGELMIRAARMVESNSFHHAVVHGDAWFTDSESPGRLHLHDVVFHRKGWFSRFRCGGRADFARTRFRGPDKFADAEFTGPVSFHEAEFAEPADFTGTRFAGDADLRLRAPAGFRAHGARVSPERENRLPDGWPGVEEVA
ncbi:pentapeptide repeat-containing protein [Saccharothrix obliqua]|uniref:pentapeptide repeat-containing protein n=1 Tax=Saccharothrix obliqua TaxID=2861747 RepID=UPI001C605273|nr:pentapeptide repeat-containing protein [Saccharothrix obliqua]MBW4715693.1 pentapeptide repeat-containing protein [Saccharothrix obliqua]